MGKFCLFVLAFTILIGIANSSENVCTYTRTCYKSGHHHCGLFGWGRCRHVRTYTCNHRACCKGWRGSRCSTPICTTPCYNGGTCIRPETCACHPSHNGNNCEQLLCSHLAPCYPGTCSLPKTCNCLKGYSDASTGCLSFSTENNLPVISDCGVTLANIRRIDNKELFFYNASCPDTDGKITFWSNQALFNYANFSLYSHYPPIEYIPPPPSYVTEYGFGIVENKVRVQHTKHAREGTGRYLALNKWYNCSTPSSSSPEINIAECFKSEPNYKYNLEHDDIFTVNYSTSSGGYRKLYDINNNRYYKTQTYTGKRIEKAIEFRFDYIAPKHCTEINATLNCPAGEKPIAIAEDITRKPINPTWDGWSDELSGIDYYYMEIFQLKPNIHGDLTELEPLNPTDTFWTNETDSIDFPIFTPNTSGMYSILLQASDKANNSKIARRLVLYDNDSTITLTKPGFLHDQPMDVGEMTVGDGGMHVISAIPETGYMWQTSEPGTKTHIVVDWTDHFVNEIHKDGKLLNKVLPYPTQFAQLQESGILRSQKYVAMDDDEGRRQLTAIPNKNGIVKFETKRIFTDDREEPTDGWEPHTLSERFEVRENLDDGSFIRLWVRATDIMDNKLSDYTEVHIDDTKPRVAGEKLKINIKNGTHTYTSRLTFLASDGDSGVHRIVYKLYVGNNSKTHKMGSVHASKNNATDACGTDPNCICALSTCFLRDQVLDIDNCWFLVPKQDLNKSASVLVEVYNQALLYENFTVNINRLSGLDGLEEYSGPTNIHIEKNLASGVRLVWDLPETASCYGRASIQVLLVSPDGSVRAINVYNEETSVDLVGLDPDNNYKVSLSMGYEGTELAAAEYSFKTAKLDNHLEGGVIAGIVIAILVIIGLMLAIFIVLLRRGHMKPVRRGLQAVSVKYRKSVVGKIGRPSGNRDNTDSLYVYGEMDFKDVDNWKLSRDDVVFDNLFKSGNFADIYIATLRSNNSTVIAKTLKRDYTTQDALLMKAKINFSSIEVGRHINVIGFVGAVVSETDIGPFIIHEYCSNGSLRDFVESLKDSVTLETQEKLYRFGRGVARGMEHLANRKVVHRHLAARNILLDSDFEVKIAGFGPQPDNKDNKEKDGAPGKRERIPIKWMAPECLKSTAGATEKSDVWSYGIVLWEIFSFGSSPYSDIRGRDLPARLKNGYRLPKPEQCDDKWYGVMKRAWSAAPKTRPTFTEIRNELDEEFVAAPTDDYYYSQQ